jgi:hypothetical protein
VYLGQCQPVLGAELSLGPEPEAGVGLDADEVVVAGDPEERVLQDLDGGVADALAPGLGHHVVHGEGEPDGEVPRPRPERFDRSDMGPGQVLVHRDEPPAVLHPRWVDALHVPEHGHDIGFVDRAGPADEIAQCGAGGGHEAAEGLGRVVGLPPAAGGEPPWAGEVVEGHHRHQPPLEAARAHPPIVVQRRP